MSHKGGLVQTEIVAGVGSSGGQGNSVGNLVWLIGLVWAGSRVICCCYCHRGFGLAGHQNIPPLFFFYTGFPYIQKKKTVLGTLGRFADLPPRRAWSK